MLVKDFLRVVVNNLKYMKNRNLLILFTSRLFLFLFFFFGAIRIQVDYKKSFSTYNKFDDVEIFRNFKNFNSALNFKYKFLRGILINKFRQ